MSLFDIKKIKIRTAKLTDFKEIIALLDEATRAIDRNGKLSQSFNPRLISRKKIFFNCLKGNGKIFVAEYHSKVVGMLNLQVVNNIRYGMQRGHIEEIVVKEELRGKGIGTQLIKYTNRWCKKRGIKVIKVFSRKSLSRVQNFFRKNKFRHGYRGFRIDLE